MGDQLLGERYRLLRQLGEGGMGQVWEARDEALGRLVAIKVIALLVGGGSRGDEARARFLREARITAALQHPNVVTVHDLGEMEVEDSRAPFLVMELLRGEALDAVVRRGPVALPDAARWGAQVSDALAEAHDAGVLHRDIKPSNILVTAVGTVKVLDFGIARAADPYRTANRLTQTGFIVGTPPYMAPEQARGFPEMRSDLYALGCLLFELITGRLPFQAPDAVGYLTAHLTQEPPAPSSVAADIPSEWDEVVLTLLRKDPGQRYASASALAQVLRRLSNGPGRTRAAGDHTESGTRRSASGGLRATHRNILDADLPADPREVLLAKMARAMKAVITSTPAHLQAPQTKKIPQQPRSHVETPPTTRLSPGRDTPFSVTWTGEEPLSAYAARPGGVRAGLWAGGWSLLAVASIYLPLRTGLMHIGPGGSDTPWIILPIAGGIMGLLALGYGVAAVLGAVQEVQHALREKRRARWALHVGPPGIETTSAAGRREFTWDQIQRVVIEEVQGSPPYRYTGVHVDLVPDAVRPTVLRPAGWIYPQPDALPARRGGRILVCVLGPMTERQRADLIEAFTRYGGQRWVPSVSFTTLPIEHG